MSIEYLGGFTIFIFILMYVFFMTLSFVPQHTEATEENIIEASAWRGMQNLMDFVVLENNKTEINKTALEALKECNIFGWHPSQADSRNNYTYFHDNILNASNSSNFHIQADSYSIALTNKKNLLNFTGSSIVDGTNISFETYNTSTKYDAVVIDNGTIMTATEGESGYVLGDDAYEVQEIDDNGQFVILYANLADCGKQPPSNNIMTNYVRFAKKGDQIIKITLTYW